MKKYHKLILDLSDRGMTRQRFGLFVRKHCQQAAQFAWSDKKTRKVCFEFDSEEARDESRRIILQGLNKMGINAKAKVS